MTYQEGLLNIQTTINGNKELEINDRLALIKQLLENQNENANLKVLKDFFNSIYFTKQIVKKKTDRRDEENYYSVGLSNVADYLLDKYNDYEQANYKDYDVWSRYEVARGRKDRENKKIIGFSQDVIDDAVSNDLPWTVQKGLEVHVDMVDDYISKSEKAFKLSEEDKRKQRKQELLDKIEEFPELKIAYDTWKQFGLTYGFDMDDYTKEDRQLLKNQWLSKFESEESIHSPNKRYYELRQQYNEMGYMLHKTMKQLQKTVKLRKSKQLTPYVDVDGQIGDTFDLGNKEHITALLKIDYDKKNKEYIPLFYVLHNDYQERVDTSLHHLFQEFNSVLETVELNDIGQDIIYLILDRHSEQSIYTEACTFNPYNLIVQYINEKYNLKKTKANIIKIIENEIASSIANEYFNSKIGTQKIKCNKCEKEKFATLVNFGLDTRNKTGFKSTCRKCAAEIEKERRNNSINN